jgi:hypothetical protein
MTDVAPAGPVLLVHVEDPPGSGRARCDGLLILDVTVASRFPRIACPGCVRRDGRSYDDGRTDGWRELLALLTGAAMSWRTKEGRAALREVLDHLPDGPR